MSRSKSGLFLMELIIAICFFAVASAICVQLFAAAHTLSRRSIGIQMAVTNAQSVAEGFKMLGDDIDTLAGIWQVPAAGGGFTAWFDEDWGMSEGGGRYEMIVEVDLESVPAIASITVVDTVFGTMLHSLSVRRYLGG